MRTIRFGVNYVPSRRWYYCWNDWNADEIAEDFDAIAALGVDHLRVQLIWAWFQPNPNYVSPLHLQRLEQLLGLAKARGLDVFLAGLTGPLSGYDFFPPSVLREQVLVKDEVIQQSVRYLEAVLAAAGRHHNFLGLDLGNEINVLDGDLPLAVGDAWGRRMIQALRPKLAGKWIVNGVDHNPWINGGTFSVRHLVADYDAVCLHTWPFFTGALLDGALDGPRSVHLPAFMTYLARHFLGQAQLQKPVWIQEFGCSREWGELKQREAFARQSVSLAIEAGATWFTWWCSHDIDPSLRFNSLEYDLGLLTTENKPKPLAEVYRELIAKFSVASPPVPLAPETMLPGIDAGFVPTTLEKLPGQQWIEQNRHSNTWQLFNRYLKARTEAPPIT